MRYQYSSRGFKQNFGGNSLLMPKGVKLLLIINISVFVFMVLSGQKNILIQMFGLVPRVLLQEYRLWQSFTYLFLHGGWIHILFNMFVLWMFGKDLEIDWGKKEFLIFYFVCGIGSGFITVFASMNSFIPIVGASGAIYGVLVAYGFTYPNRMVYLYGVFPLRVKYVVLGFGVITFIASLSSTQSQVSHITHLSGMIIGALYIVFNFRWKNIRLWYIKMRLKSSPITENNQEDKENNIKMKVDKLLDKLNNQGWDSLTAKEEEFLNHASKRLYDDRPPN